ncbi:DoxX family protein [Streptomyces flavidovirens]|uniref:DoxX family protein n=1 Tax=Streptomyces flavidovirens TaxID=67298 RepID=UPI0034263AD3
MTPSRTAKVRDVLAITRLRRLEPVAPLAARVTTGIVFIAHGVEKLMDGTAGFSGWIASRGVPAPQLTGWLVALLETFGGLFLVLGLLSRLTSTALTVLLSFAIALGNSHIGFLTPLSGEARGAGIEFPLVMIGALHVVMFAGPGALSLDRLLGLEVCAEGSRSRRARGVSSPMRPSA